MGSGEMKSILQTEKECFICRDTRMLECHHIFGGANRKISEKYGLKVYLCKAHHKAVHRNRALGDELRRIGQRAYEKRYGDKNAFMADFGQDWLWRERDTTKAVPPAKTPTSQAWEASQ